MLRVTEIDLMIILHAYAEYAERARAEGYIVASLQVVIEALGSHSTMYADLAERARARGYIRAADDWEYHAAAITELRDKLVAQSKR